MAGSAGGGTLSPQPIKGYELQRKLGEGGMGAVYLARQKSMDRLVALKILRRNLARNTDFVARFVREARLAGKLDHENIVRALDVGESGDYHYLAMEFVDGCNLSALLRERGALPEKEALGLALQVARALEYADSRRIIHRDIKPDNVLLTGDGIAKLTDLGLAKQTGAETHITQTGVMVGTPHYVSPEQARGEQDVDIRGDIYSLGATLYRLVTGKTPFEGSTAAVVMTKHLTEEPPPPREINPDVSHKTSRIIYKAMAKNRDVRYQTPAELIADIESVLAGRMPRHAQNRRAGDTASTRPVAKLRGRRREGETGHGEEPIEGGRFALPLSAMIGIAAGVLLAGGIGIWALTGGPETPRELSPSPPKKGPAPEQPPDPPPDTPEQDKNHEDMFKYAEEFWKKNPDKYKEARGKFEYVRREAAGDVWGMKADDMVKAVDEARGKAAEVIFAATKVKADDLEKAGDYDAAIAAWMTVPGRVTDLLMPRYKRERNELHKRAGVRMEAALKAATELSKAGRPEEGIAKLDEVKAVRYAATANKIAALRARLGKEKEDVAALAEKRKLADARKQLGGILEDFDKLMLSGKHKEACAHLDAKRKAAGEDAVALVAAEFDAAGKVGKALEKYAGERSEAMKKLVGKDVVLTKKDGSVHRVKIMRVDAEGFFVERRFKIMGAWQTTGYPVKCADLAAGELDRLLPVFKPTDADGQVAAALIGIAGKDFAAAEKALGEAAKHPLHKRYAELLDEKKLGAVEAGAKKAWETGVEVREKYDLAGAKKLLAALDGFEKAHGKTKFGRGKVDEVKKLRALAQDAIEASPEGMLSKVRKLYHGRVEGFDSKTRTIELFYDFKDPLHLRDWELSAFAAGGRKGEPLVIGQERLHLQTTGRCALLKGLFRGSMSIGADFHIHAGQGDCTVVVCADEQGNYYNLFGLQSSGNSYMERYAKGKWRALGKVLKSPYAVSKQGNIYFSYQDGQLAGRVGKLQFRAKDSTYPFGRVGLWAFSTHVSFDNIKVKGILDKTWLEQELARLSASARPAPSYRAHWQKLKIVGKGPPGRERAEQALAYDSKRKRVVLYGGFKKKDLWQLETAAGRWTCLEPGSPSSPAVRLHTVRYDSGSDCYWAMAATACHAYSPKTRTWKDLGLPAGMPQWGSSNTRNGWAYDPDGHRFLRIYSGGQAYSFYPADGRVEQAVSMGKIRPGYMDGGLVYDRGRKVFVLFGGYENKKLCDRTWIYSPKLKQWRQVNSEKAPPARAYHNLQWHDKLGSVVLADGTRSDRKESDVWVFDSAAERWTQAKMTGFSPAPSGGATTYDASNGLVVHFNVKTTAVSVLKITVAAGAK